MCKIIGKYGVHIRKMQGCENDYEVLYKCLSDEAVLEFYEGRDNPFDLEKIGEYRDSLIMVNRKGGN